MDSSQLTALGDQHFREEPKQILDYNSLQQVQRRSHAPAKATHSQQSGIHIEPLKIYSSMKTAKSQQEKT